MSVINIKKKTKKKTIYSKRLFPSHTPKTTQLSKGASQHWFRKQHHSSAFSVDVWSPADPNTRSSLPLSSGEWEGKKREKYTNTKVQGALCSHPAKRHVGPLWHHVLARAAEAKRPPIRRLKNQRLNCPPWQRSGLSSEWGSPLQSFVCGTDDEQ